MTDRRQFSLFFAQIASLADAEVGAAHSVTPRFSALKSVVQLDAPFYGHLQQFFTGEALVKIDSLCSNSYWFYLLLGTTLALSAKVQADLDDVSVAVLRLRAIIAAPLGEKVVALVRTGNFESLAESDFIAAGKAGLIVIDDTNPEGDALLINGLLVGLI
jgi:hypothetical protein